jgi:hypothetical protein
MVMDLLKSIQAYAQSIPADFREKKGSCDLSFTVAERKGFLSKQKLTYQAKFRIDDQEKIVHFAEMLKEASSGMDAGMGFQTTSYSAGKGGQQNSVIEQQSDQFGKKYDYQFDFKKIRGEVEKLAKEAGYTFQYQITFKGL